MPSVGILAAGDGWHVRALSGALSRLGLESSRVDPTRLAAEIDSEGAPPGSLGTRGAAAALDRFDALLVRLIPPGSLDQIVFRIDLLHLLADAGLPIVNPPRCLERTIDKHWTTRLLAAAGIPTPRTFVAERAEDALLAFARLGDVVVKPLLGSGGRGIFRVSDQDHAWRAFRALEEQRAVLYVQEFVPHGGCDLRLFVAGGEVVAAMRREADGWKSNVAAGARVAPHRATPGQEDLARRATAAVGADYAGVDLLEAEDGRLLVVEVNGIPGWSALQETTSCDIAAVVAGRVRARLAGRS